MAEFRLLKESYTLILRNHENTNYCFLKYLGHVDLDVSTDADESHTRQEKDEVEQKDNVFDENVTTIHLDRL